LEALLADLPGDDAMTFEELDGFFAALIHGPENVMPAGTCSGLGPIHRTNGRLQSFEEASTILELMMRHWHHITLTP